MLKFIHLTDPHLVGRREALYGTDPAWRLKACLADIAAKEADAAFCLITGDLTHRGGAESFALLKELLDPFPLPVHLVIGNHDTRPEVHEIFPAAFCDPNGFVQGSFDTAEGSFIILDTMEPGVSHGVFCAERAAWLAAELKAKADKPVFIALHHPPFPVGIPGMDRISLRDPTHFNAAIAPHRQHIRHIFFGHLHRPISGSWRGIPFSTLHGTNHQVALELGNYLSIEQAIAEHAPVNGTVEAPHYAVVLIDADHVIVHHRLFLTGPAQFRL